MNAFTPAIAIPTMTSLELTDFINDDRKARAQAVGAAFPSPGFARLEHKHLLDKVPDVLGERSAEFSANLPDAYGRPRRGYRFAKREACLLAMSYSYALQAKVFDRMTALEARETLQSRALTPAEMFLQNAQAMVEVERRQIAQGEEMARLSESVETLMVGSMTLTERPSNSESITHIRPRMLAKYQLPARIVDLVMRQLPYSPKPAGMVRNQREEALGASYAVFWTKDVNTTFARFVKECTRVTATKVTHPDIPERFTLAPGVEVRHG
ncbi:hypothetical protein ACFIQF_19250 [Comamonas sp. J-3]|uniref:hypothetical protein n=1 Tax=Comamonas trifloxystrobinivorans TaxID=3350256 RepID=UPI00372A65D0